MAETCCSIESSASKVTPRGFTTFEKGMDASPTERQWARTHSLLGAGPQRSTWVSCSLSVSLLFVIHIFIWRQQDSIFLKALSEDSGSAGRHEYSSESSAKKSVYAELINEVCQLPSVKKKEKRIQYLHDKYDENQSRAEPPKPISAWSLCRSNVWSVVLKAALRSTSYVHEDYTLWCTCRNTRRLEYTERAHHNGYGWIPLPKHLFARSRTNTAKTLGRRLEDSKHKKTGRHRVSTTKRWSWLINTRSSHSQPPRSECPAVTHQWSDILQCMTDYLWP